MVFGEELHELGPVEGDVAAEEPLRVGQQHRRPALDRHVAMGHRALQGEHRRHPVQVRRVCGQVVGCNEAEVIVAMRNLLFATGIDDIDLRRELVARAKPGLGDDGERVVGVVVGEHVGGMQRELLRGVPDAVVRAGRAEVVAGRRAVRALSLDDGVEGVAGAIDDVGGERVFEHDDARPVGQRTDQLGLQGAPVGRRGGRIDQDVLAHIDGVRVVGEVGISQHLGPELVKPAVGLVDPRLVCSGQRRCHGS